ncbi:unnamed protein product [Notodromas monacha]|uniref:G-protein coupled receptors family 1 profile domain-containing protein n=1 Tax=Notodromas monacha TaxID=399045 RepID=A0A7R9BHF8_9CRUS|nr:unnamed protein product [Notodromas monacha]CAG0915555.1 unnamed protein product [Notodromas monacha]
MNQTRDEPVALFQNYSAVLLNFAVGCCILFMSLGIPGNICTIAALHRSKIHSATAIFIINLSVSDLMFCCFNIPLATSLYMNRKWIHGDALCQLYPFFRYGLVAVSIFTVLAITINRYIMIAHPRWYRTRAVAGEHGVHSQPLSATPFTL